MEVALQWISKQKEFGKGKWVSSDFRQLIQGEIMQDGLYWGQQFQAKKISVPEWIDERTKMFAKINPKLNAIVTWDPQAAKEQYSVSADQLQGPFYGLPIPLKMLGQSKAGWPETFSARLFQNNIANQTANFVKKIEASSLIPLGQTNAPEFGFKNVTDPELYGSTRNAWNIAYSPGGSSGGAATAVANGLFPLAGASDGGGSIRIPASFSGLIGLKPTRGSMPVGPGSYRGWQGAAIDFALTISMRDTAALFYHLRGTPKAAPYQAPPAEWVHDAASQKPKFKIAYTTVSPIGSKVSPEAISAVESAVEFLRQQGHEVTEIPYPLDGKALIREYYRMNGAETAAMFADIEAGMQRDLNQEDMELMTWGIFQFGKKIPAANYIRSLQAWDQAAFVMEELFRTYDLFLTPTTAYPAPKITADLQNDQIRRELGNSAEQNLAQLDDLIYRMFEKGLELTPFTQLANLTGQPAISLPMHVTKDGLPLGIHFMASKGREDQLFQIGQLFETQAGFKLPEFYHE